MLKYVLKRQQYYTVFEKSKFENGETNTVRNITYKRKRKVIFVKFRVRIIFAIYMLHIFSSQVDLVHFD